jgi:acetyl-CoA carboxylase biotin carboxyl carrier protein
MDPQQIKAFIDAMQASDLTEMEFSQDGWTLRLVRDGANAVRPELVLRQAQDDRGLRQAQPERATTTTATPPAAKELAAPLFGVVHLQQSPGDPPFVVAGQTVKAGQTLCVIEAMKVFNEVRADADATVAEVLVTSGQEVEAGQPLLRFA